MLHIPYHNIGLTHSMLNLHTLYEACSNCFYTISKALENWKNYECSKK